MEQEKYYPQVIENFACRNFKIGDEVKAYFKGKWFSGEVVKKYSKTKDKVPYVLVKTKEKVDKAPGAYLGGFGLEYSVGSPRIIFGNENEYSRGDEIYKREILREMTDEEKKENDDIPF